MADQFIAELLSKVAERIGRRTRALPNSTYRLQFHAGFTFQDARRIVPYLQELGITHCYASPYLKARPGSTHGYNIIDHKHLNPEVGTVEDYDAWVAALHEHLMGQILDIVPNHMGILGNENPWWNDVLENGPASPYSDFFEINWYSSSRPELQAKVLLPILGDSYGEVLEAGQLKLVYKNGAFAIEYYEHRFPIDPRTFDTILSHQRTAIEEKLDPADSNLSEFHSILTSISHLPAHTETEANRAAERIREKEIIKRRLAALTENAPVIREAIDQSIQYFNGQPGEPSSFDLLDQLLDRQAYRLSFWRVASDEINYRRFFDVNELIALNMDRENVFQTTHDLVLRLLADDKLDGLRIDHPDGLFNPRQYLGRLQSNFVLAIAKQFFDSLEGEPHQSWSELEPAIRTTIEESEQFRRPLYVLVEKITSRNEVLDGRWPVYGTTGYEFLNLVNGLFVDGNAVAALTQIYDEHRGDDTPFSEIAFQSKFLILQVALASELHVLAWHLDRLAQNNRRSRDFTLNTLRHALRAVLAAFPVYRSYISDTEISSTDRRFVLDALRRAMAHNPTMSRVLFQFIRDMLLKQDEPESAPTKERRYFAGKFQQVSAPVMAKGVEDTAFYIYNRLLSLNEVGGEPDRFGVTPESLHNFCRDRQEKWPYAMSTLSTHDTKRSESVRARLNVLSELHQEWADAARKWKQINQRNRLNIDDVEVPDGNEEYFLYQTLVGTWPLEPMTDAARPDYIGRIQAYMTKALHEAKVHSSWINPDEAYDQAINQFIERILDPQGNDEFLDHFQKFTSRIAHYGLINALAQTMLKLTLPGVPDVYQGVELWDFSLVDPDNRRPVNYEIRQQHLNELKKRFGNINDPARLDHLSQLVSTRIDGRIKMFVIWQSLQLRRQHPDLFTTGEYIELKTTGPKSANVFAFLRRTENTSALIAIPRLVTQIWPDPFNLHFHNWSDTGIELPDDISTTSFRNLFTGQRQKLERTLRLDQVLKNFPVAVLVPEK